MNAILFLKKFAIPLQQCLKYEPLYGIHLVFVSHPFREVIKVDLNVNLVLFKIRTTMSGRAGIKYVRHFLDVKYSALMLKISILMLYLY